MPLAEAKLCLSWKGNKRENTCFFKQNRASHRRKRNAFFVSRLAKAKKHAFSHFLKKKLKKTGGKLRKIGGKISKIG